MRSKENLPSNVTKEVQANGVEMIRLAKSPMLSSPPTLKSCLKPESRASSLGRHASLRSSSPATAAKLVNFKQTEDGRDRVKSTPDLGNDYEWVEFNIKRDPQWTGSNQHRPW